MAVIATAEVRVVADTSRFLQQLRRQLRGSFGGLGGDLGRRLGRQISDSATDEMDRRMRTGLRQVERTVDRGGRRIARSMRRHIVAGTQRAIDAVQTLGRALASIVSAATLRPLAALGGLFSDFASEMAEAAAVGLIVLGVIEQLSGAAFALPAGLAVLAGAIATVTVAFRGMGRAFSAALGDAEDFNDAIADLAPSAADAAREFRALRGDLRRIRLDAQEALWSELDGAITRVADNLMGPLREGLTEASGALGRVLDGVADFLAEAATADTVAAAFDAVTAVFDAMADEIAPVLRGMRTITDEFLPRFEDLEDVIDGIGSRFEAWAEAITAPRDELGGISEAMDAFNQSIAFIETIGRIIGNVFRTIRAIFTATADNGVSLLTTIEALTENIAEMAESPAGQAGLANFFDNLDRIVAQVLPLVGTLLAQFGEISGPLADIAEDVGPDLTEFIENLGEGLANLLREGRPFFEEFAQELSEIDFAGLGQNFGEFLAAIAPAVDVIGGIISAIVDFFSGVAGFLSGVQNVLNTIGDFFIEIGEGFQNFADEWKEFWLGLAQQAIDEITGLVEEILEGWGNLWDDLFGSADTGFLNLLGLFDLRGGEIDLSWSGLWSGLESTLGLSLGNIGSEVSGATSGISGTISSFASSISSRWSGLWSRARETVSGAWSAIVSRVSGAVSGLRGAFRSAVSAISGFFSSVISTVSGAASTISGYISSITSAIQSIPSVPSLSDLNPFADGGLVNSPTFALIGEAGPEVVIPLSRPARAAQLAEESGLAAMLGGIGGGDGERRDPIEVHMHVASNNTDPDQVARKAIRQIRREIEGGGLDRLERRR